LLANANQLSEEERRARVAEASMMRHVADELLITFRKRSTDSQERMWRKSSLFAIDSFQNFGQVSAAILSLKGFQNHRFEGPNQLVSLASSSVAALNPLTSWAIGVAAGVRHKHSLNKAFPEMSSKLKATEEQWGTVISGLMATSSDRRDMRELAFLSEKSAKLDEQVDKEIKKIDKLRRVADQQAISGPLIELASVAKEICGTVGFYRYRSEPIIRNRIQFAGRISSMTGQSYSLFKTPYTQLQNISNHYRLRRQGKLPAQLAADSLAKLDAIERQVQEKGFNPPTNGSDRLPPS
jgi:hypothetical protein